MTFPEAGIQILEKAGHPLHLQEIVAQAISEGLLSHVGQIPEKVMRHRLVALAKRSSERKLMVVGPGQFALTDWGLPEDSTALAELDQEEEPADEKPLRGKERHPPISKPMSSRSEASREQGGRSKKKRRLPPLSAVVADLLGETGASEELDALLARGRDKGLMSDDLTHDTLLNALHEENRRRAKAGRGAAFELVDGVVTLLSREVLEVAAPSIPQPPLGHEAEVGEVAPERAGSSAAPLTLDSRRQTARQLKRRVQELSNAGVERLALLLLSKSGYREARPSRVAGAEVDRLFITRRKLGLTELRFLVQILPIGREATRESVLALRQKMVEAEAHAAVVIGPGEASRDARAESQRVGAPLLTLLCADSFIEELVVRQIGVIVFEATAVDDPFWRNFRQAAEGPRRAAREAEPSPRAEPRQGGRPRRERGARVALEDTAAVAPAPAQHVEGGEVLAPSSETPVLEPNTEPPALELVAFLSEVPVRLASDELQEIAEPSQTGDLPLLRAQGVEVLAPAAPQEPIKGGGL